MTLNLFFKCHYWKILVFILVIINYSRSYAQQVPNTMNFSEIKLSIDGDAKKQIQRFVHDISNERILKQNIQRCNLLMPTIEEILLENNIPQDFKFLPIVVSNLIPNIQGVDGEAGYWFITQAEARSYGLKSDYSIDERMHIILSTEMICDFFRKNHQQLDNWLFTLLSYEIGLEATKNQKNISNYRGVSNLTITSNTHTFVKKYLAYMLVYEKALLENNSAKFKLKSFENPQGKTLEEIARQSGNDYLTVQELNQWLKLSKVTMQVNQAVLVPFKMEEQAFVKITDPQENPAPISSVKPRNNDKKPKSVYPNPKVPHKEEKFTPAFHIVQPKQTLYSIARMYDVSLKELRMWNAMTHDATLIRAGQRLLLRPDDFYTHKVKTKETLYSISKKYGVSIEDIKKANRLEGIVINIGQILYIPDKSRKVGNSEQKKTSVVKEYERKRMNDKIIRD